MWAEEFHVLLIHPEEPLDPNRHLCRCSWGCIPPAPCPAAAADAVGAAISTALIGGLVVVNARLGLALGVLPFGHAQLELSAPRKSSSWVGHRLEATDQACATSLRHVPAPALAVHLGEIVGEGSWGPGWLAGQLTSGIRGGGKRMSQVHLGGWKWQSLQPLPLPPPPGSHDDLPILGCSWGNQF
ncbi:uncharacterized protein H6S33_012263 [Morchella sextelata]|uniref:uncharacterized protein n=1 Tax=Morchella sextelata TaxID=1174677 RepID=UPI001D0563B0|nr:uncharacterized protein H6S33_012263 [Morchella sextelata]KAH0609717.1 hypothetical protein H6S33_012263 [Morchella sextelata]